MEIPDMRVGIGVDAHAYRADKKTPLHLAALEWPNEIALAGHSDADVAAHAACDALLSASGCGDLGSVFGTSRPEWKNAAGAALLAETLRILRQAGWQVQNISIQIIGERPRFAPRKAEAEQKLQEIVGAPVSITATTTDHLGFTGRSEGLAAIATALIYRKRG